MNNDPERQASQLLQCLVRDKKPLGLFLGAGCPSSIKDVSGNPLIPDISGLTRVVKENLIDGNCSAYWNKICDQLSEDGRSQPNIEDILSRVRGLQEYAGSGEVRGLKKSDLDGLEKEICGKIKESVHKNLPDNLTPYHNVAAWIGAIDRSDPVEIFTTNYDLLMEQALEDHRIPFFDGFAGSRQPFFDPYAIENDKMPSRWARLWKLHGSINWRSESSNDEIQVWRTDSESGGNVVIHPSHLKYEQSRKMPYLAMMDRLQRFINTPTSALIVIGYSFGDQHLNDVIIQSLQGSPSSGVFALVHSHLSKYSEAVRIAKTRSNLSLIARDGSVIGTKENFWETVLEKPDSNLPTGTIDWQNDSNESEKWKATFRLGDFNCFGAFLQDIAGLKDIARSSDG